MVFEERGKQGNQTAKLAHFVSTINNERVFDKATLQELGLTEKTIVTAGLSGVLVSVVYLLFMYHERVSAFRLRISLQNVRSLLRSRGPAVSRSGVNT